MKGPLDHPEASDLFVQLLVSLTNESDRGSVLLAAAHADNHLHDLFQAVLPNDLSNAKRRKLLDYDGPLGTFSARINVAHALRLIPTSTYDSLHALRKLRNDVAHNPSTFKLHEHEDRLRDVLALGPNAPAGIRGLAQEMMFEQKKRAIFKAMEEFAEEHPDALPIFESEDDLRKLITGSEEIKEALKSQLPIWELIIGTHLVCATIIYHRDKARAVLDSVQTFGELAPDLEN